MSWFRISFKKKIYKFDVTFLDYTFDQIQYMNTLDQKNACKNLSGLHKILYRKLVKIERALLTITNQRIFVIHKVTNQSMDRTE